MISSDSGQVKVNLRDRREVPRFALATELEAVWSSLEDVHPMRVRWCRCCIVTGSGVSRRWLQRDTPRKEQRQSSKQSIMGQHPIGVQLPEPHSFENRCLKVTSSSRRLVLSWSIWERQSFTGRKVRLMSRSRKRVSAHGRREGGAQATCPRGLSLVCIGIEPTVDVLEDGQLVQRFGFVPLSPEYYLLTATPPFRDIVSLTDGDRSEHEVESLGQRFPRQLLMQLLESGTCRFSLWRGSRCKVNESSFKKARTNELTNFESKLIKRSELCDWRSLS